MLRQMLRVVGVSSLLVAAPLSVAGAADMSMPLKAPLASPPPAYAWTGCYINGGGGFALWNQDYYAQDTVTGAATLSSTAGGRGWMGVFGGGCDYQFSLGALGNWVIGVFGDYDPMDIEGTNQPGLLVGNEKESSAWFVGGRLGYLVTPSLMTFFDGGYTQTRFDGVNFTSITNVPTTLSLSSQTYNGWFLGGGTEYALNYSWLPIHGLFWRNEYRYATYDSAVLPFISTTGVPTGLAETSKPYVQTITSSLVWRFNWMGQ